MTPTRLDVQVARAASSAALLIVLSSACAEPSFVSLGRNLSRVTLGPDAGVTEDDPSEPYLEPDACVPGSATTAIATACDLRTPVACPAISPEEPEPVSALLTLMLIACAADRNRLSVRFSLGCATSFDLDGSDPLVAACVAARLSAERYACAESVACGQGTNFPVPTSSVEAEWY